MTIPAFILGTIAAGILSVLYHVIRGGSLGRLVLYVLMGIIFFWIGHTIADILKFTFLSLGPIRAGAAVLICIGGLVLAEFLSEVEDIPEDY